MIETRKDLQTVLEYEEKKYFTNKHEKKELAAMREPFFLCWKYTRLLRMVEFHHNNVGLYHKLLYGIYRRKKNKMGLSLGIEMWDNSFEEGIIIYHPGNVVVNGNARIGKNCKLHGDNCIGNNGLDENAPVIGDNVDIGVGAKIIGGITIANNVKIGAGAVVIHSCLQEGATLAGIPARIVKK